MTYWNPERYVRLPETAPRREYARGEFYATDVITDYAIDFAARARELHKPLFLHVATTPRISRCKRPANASITTWKSI